MATDQSPFYIIPADVQGRIMESLKLALEMAKESYPHLVEGLQFTIERTEAQMESFIGSHNKPAGTHKAFNK